MGKLLKAETDGDLEPGLVFDLNPQRQVARAGFPCSHAAG